ncbi:MAG: PAS domain S-box protein, partial [Chthoniobacterales bacterium]
MAIILPIVLGTLRLVGERAGLYDGGFGAALYTFSVVVVFLAAIFWTARLLSRLEQDHKVAEAARRENEERFRQLAEHVGDVFWIKSLPDRRLVYVSPGYEEIWGRPVQTVYDNPRAAIDAMHPDDLPRVRKVFAGNTALNTWEVEYRVLRPDGSIRWINDRAFPVCDENGRIYRLAGIASDITARKGAQDELDRFFTVSLDMLTTIGFDGKFKRVNPAWEKTLGWTAEEMCGVPFIDFVHPDDRAATTAEAERLATGCETVGFENRYRCRDGSHRWFLWSAAADLETQILHCTARDITMAKEAEEERSRLANQIRMLMDSTSEGIYGIDQHCRCTFINNAGAALLGFPASELIGRDLHELIHHHRRDGSPFPVEECPIYRARREGGDVRVDDEVFWRKDGSSFPVEYSCSPIVQDGAIHGVVITFTDITVRKKADEETCKAWKEAERANRAKSEFLSRMSHELRTPLNAILGFGQLLEMEKLSREQQESAGHIVSAGRHLLDLINEVLDISRIEAGRMALSLEPVSLSNVLRDVLNLVRPLATGCKIRIQNFADEMPEVFVQADRQRLKQVFVNLLSNAIKYNRQEGEVRIAIEADVAPAPPGARVRVDIADTGIGLQPGALSRLFTPFERLGAERTTVEGTGLGLALTKRLVEMMSGKIEVRSQAGVGSTFTVELSAAEDPVTALKSSTGRVDLEILPRIAGKTILYIEDNDSNFQLVEQVLARRATVNLLSAVEGRVGLELARKHRPDLILLDLHLPDIDGGEVLEQLRSDDRTRTIPVIVIS